MDYREQEHYYLEVIVVVQGRWGWLRPLLCHHQQGGMERSGVNIVLGDGVDRDLLDELDVKHVQDSEPGFCLSNWIGCIERCLICRV